MIHQGNKYGVKIKSVSPSIHMIKTNIETEIAPIVGSGAAGGGSDRLYQRERKEPGGNLEYQHFRQIRRAAR